MMLLEMLGNGLQSISINSRGQYVNRGGYYDNGVFTASERRPYNDEAIYPSFGFRVILYIK